MPSSLLIAHFYHYVKESRLSSIHCMFCLPFFQSASTRLKNISLYALLAFCKNRVSPGSVRTTPKATSGRMSTSTYRVRGRIAQAAHPAVTSKQPGRRDPNPPGSVHTFGQRAARASCGVAILAARKLATPTPGRGAEKEKKRTKNQTQRSCRRETLAQATDFNLISMFVSSDISRLPSRLVCTKPKKCVRAKLLIPSQNCQKGWYSRSLAGCVTSTVRAKFRLGGRTFETMSLLHFRISKACRLAGTSTFSCAPSTSTKRPSHPAYLSLLAFVTTISPMAQEFWLLVNAQAIVFPCLIKACNLQRVRSLPNHNLYAIILHLGLCLPRMILPLRSRLFSTSAIASWACPVLLELMAFLSVMPKSRKNRAKPLSIAKID